MELEWVLKLTVNGNKGLGWELEMECQNLILNRNENWRWC